MDKEGRKREREAVQVQFNNNSRMEMKSGETHVIQALNGLDWVDFSFPRLDLFITAIFDVDDT